MAMHKVPLDVEADDKFLGPLSFRQFLFAGGTVVFGYLTFLMISSGIWPVSIIFFIPGLCFAILAIPWSKEQPSELFLASRIRFFIKPRRRVWDQAGIKNLVSVTAPVREVHLYTDGLNQDEVRSRFNALATLVDSRGWAIKHAGPQTITHAQPSDRLVNTTLPQQSATIIDTTADEDVLDESNSTIARQFDTMIEQSERHNKSAALALVEKARNAGQPQASSPATPPAPEATTDDFWFKHENQAISDTQLATFQTSSVISPGSTAQTPNPTSNPVQQGTELSEQELLEKAHEKQRRDALQTGSSHGAVINPYGTTPTPDPAQQQPAPYQYTQPAATTTPIPDPVQQNAPVIPPPDPGILELAQSNDLNVETIARQANKGKNDGEVVISLH